MALRSEKYIPSADYTYANAYHRISRVTFKLLRDEVSLEVWTYKDEDVASKNPGSPMIKESFDISLDSLGGKANVSLAKLYDGIKKLDRFMDAEDC